MKPILTAAILFSATVAATAAYPPLQATQADATPAAQEEELASVGEETTERVCNECHALDEVTATRRTVRDWDEMVAAMANRGATATDDEFALIKRYLTRYFGLVPVNSAPAQDFAGVLGLSLQDAERIVAYRQEHGRFADAGALLQVPGIDRMKIEAQPEALRFDAGR